MFIRRDLHDPAMGLENLKAQLEAVGGQLITDDPPDRWITRVVIPPTPHTRSPAGG